jgi:uncharacterized membrane protein
VNLIVELLIIYGFYQLSRMVLHAKGLEEALKDIRREQEEWIEFNVRIEIEVDERKDKS